MGDVERNVIIGVLWPHTLVGAIAVSLAARPAPGAPRVAHLPQPRLDDYLQRSPARIRRHPARTPRPDQG